MKIKLHTGKEKLVKKSGIGKAMQQQRKALDLAGVDYVTDQSHHYDILHINTIFLDSIKAMKHARSIGAKIIYHAHSTEEDFKNSFMFSNLLAPLFKRWISYLYKQADYILTPTPYSKSILETYHLKTPIEAISNGVDLMAFNPEVEVNDLLFGKWNVLPEDKLIMSVGWLFERKGFDDFVAVARKLPDYQFIWFGDAKLSKPTRKIRRLLKDLPDNVILPGYVSRDILKSVYVRSDVFFFPSREETEGIAVLEALAMACEIVLRDIPVFNPWLEDGVHCYKGKGIDEFVALIEGIISKQKPSTGKKGREVAEARNFESIGLALKEVYKKVLEI